MSLTEPIPRARANPFPGDGEMAAAMRALDWTRTALGPPESWPQSLRTTLDICLVSRFPIVLWWGPELTMLYNDAYRQIIADKHPVALGRSAREAWAEIWDVIGPMLHGVMERGTATWSEDQLLFLRRHGFPEECYFTFSYSPIHDESGGVGGVFCAVTETTPQLLRQRRLTLVRDLPVQAADAAAASRRTLEVLDGYRKDFPFARFYREGADGQLKETVGDDDRAPAPPSASLRDLRDLAVLPAADVMPLDSIPPDPWGDVPTHVAAIPIERSVGEGRWGVLVLGIAPRLVLDDEYRDLMRLVGTSLASVMSGSEALAVERQHAAALAELDRAKTAFFTNISHEFRTPLTLLLGPLDELDRAELDGQNRARVDLARRNARRLYRLVNALLEFSRIEAGRMQASFEAVDIAAFTSQLASMFRSAFDTAGVRLVIDAAPIEAPVYVDREMWERIVLNLVSNAFKHTYRGEVRVAIGAEAGTLVLAVSDTGVGIPPEELDRVFERFHRVDSPGARTHEGSGIGLALVRELVHLHGGEITAASEVDHGSRFEVRIPLGRGHLPATQVRGEATRGGDAAIARAFVDEALSWLPAERGEEPIVVADAGQRARILVVDDNADMRRYITSVLEPEYEVEVATDGLDALSSIDRRRPAIVLADVMMPRLDGYGLVARVRAEPATRTLPIVLLSARAGEDAAIEGLATGADDYLVKPFGAGDLRARVAAHLATSRLRELATAELQTAEAQFRTLVEQNPSGIALLDAGGSLTYANPTWLEYLGRSVDDLRGWDWTVHIHPDDAEDVTGRARAALATGTTASMECRMRRHDGTFRWFAATMTAVRDSGGDIRSWIVVSVDINDRREAEGALRIALARLQDNEAELRRALAAKDEFLSMVSHELRTPLTTILGNARVLVGRARTLDVEVQGSALSDIADEAERLNQVIENLLVLARLETGRALELEPVLIGRLVAAIVETERRGDPSRDFVITGCDARLVAIANPDALGQVLANLLSNAAKYSPGGQPIEVSCSLDDGEVAIVVSDRGLGVDPRETERIFEPFFRSERTVAMSGMGIGLSVCRRLVEANGGTLEAAPRPGGGSSFTVRLPVAEDEVAEVPALA